MSAVRHIELNANYWNSDAASYQKEHPEHRDGRRHPSWGLLHIPETKAQLVTPYVSPNACLLDLGCGDAHDAHAFAMQGMNVIGVDISDKQLSFARSAVNLKLLHVPAENLPIESGTIDLAYSDHGAFDHSPSELLLDEVSRVLRAGAYLVVCTYSPMSFACFDAEKGHLDTRLHSEYPTSHVKSSTLCTSVERSYAEWIAVFRRFNFEIIKLEEFRASDGGANSFDQLVSPEWASKWPCDIAWVVRKMR